MANMNIGTPRFYTDQISYLMSRGVAQDGNFDVTATHAGNTFMGTFTTGSEPELFDMRPLNKCTFDTSADIDGHVLITIDTQSSTLKKNYIAILNHNLVSAVGKIRIFAGDAASDVTALDGANADTSDIAFDSNTLTEVVNGDTTTGAANNKSAVIEPATDGSTIIKFGETGLRYWAIQLEGNTTNTGAAVNGTWGSTDVFVGCIMIGEYYDMPHAPDMNVTRMISYNRMNDLQESYGGQRFSNLKSFGRTAGSTSKSPFTTGSNGYDSYGGRIIYDMSFSFLDSTNLMPDEYDIVAADDSFVADVWTMTSGNHIPFIFSIDKDSEGPNAESEHIFARFANNSLDMTQAAPSVFNIKLTVEEEF
tara:strand:- start:45 stop:1136 length:1092 start_codon:yes stop_codon:yes gene_type:complete